MVLLDIGSHAADVAVQLLTPSYMSSPLHPPGFLAASFASSPSTTPVFMSRLCSPVFAVTTPPTSTPPASPAPESQSSSQASLASSPPRRSSLFAPVMPALLPQPGCEVSPRPTAATNRHKTLAGGYTVRRSSIRINAGHRGIPIARMAELNLCRRLGIIEESEDITEQAVQEFVDMFKNQVPANSVAALRALFRLDNAHADAVEAALINHGGEEALDQEATGST